ncbi:MAG: phospho-N-acetylmuramoyl-pentapeptide-transferase [Gemmatimonadetes bacterium]|nr:phospho-N-acetylmuramoyl-pentapeptide-transferase [Gemmatimonadota bacterium]
MLAHLLPELSELFGPFNVFVYISFRTAGAVVTSLVLAFLLGPVVIRRLKLMNVGQVVREIGPETHLAKSGTPTMGGVIIILATTISTLLWARLDNAYTIVALVSLLWMGAIGFLDDYLKVVQGQTRGLIAKYKMIGQWSFGLALGTYLIWNPISGHPTTWTAVPFFADVAAVFSVPVFIVFTGVVVSGSSNAVNLTDGLDGLAAGLIAIASATIGIFAYVAGRVDTSQYLGFFYLPGAGELTIFALALSGAALGFLWFNAPPAEVFMGDTGSLALGGALGVMAILLKAEFLLVIVGGVFVLETLSVIVQRGWFKYTKWRFGSGRRVFRMAPVHHHFEKLGWSETTVVIRFWIVGVLFAMLAFSTLKIR